MVVAVPASDAGHAEPTYVSGPASGVPDATIPGGPGAQVNVRPARRNLIPAGAAHPWISVQAASGRYSLPKLIGEIDAVLRARRSRWDDLFDLTGNIRIVEVTEPSGGGIPAGVYVDVAHLMAAIPGLLNLRSFSEDIERMQVRNKDGGPTTSAFGQVYTLPDACILSAQPLWQSAEEVPEACRPTAYPSSTENPHSALPGWSGQPPVGKEVFTIHQLDASEKPRWPTVDVRPATDVHWVRPGAQAD